MAIWQVALNLVKKDDCIDFSSPAFISSLKTIDDFFPATKSWCETIMQYGRLDSTCLELDTDDNEAISLRVDLRSITKDQLQTLCNFAKGNDLFIKYNDTIYECSFNTFLSIFKESNANRFLLDPEAFLNEINE